MCVDAKAAIAIAENLGVTGRNKHFTDAIHYFRHLYDHRVVLPLYVTNKHQRADGFTKPLEGHAFTSWRSEVINLPV